MEKKLFMAGLSGVEAGYPIKIYGSCPQMGQISDHSYQIQLKTIHYFSDPIPTGHQMDNEFCSLNQEGNQITVSSGLSCNVETVDEQRSTSMRKSVAGGLAPVLVWMDGGRAILFSAGRLDVPEKDHFHDIYRYEIATGKLRRLTYPTKFPYNESDPHWIAGPLPVSRQGKLPMQWGNIKAIYGY